MRTYRLASRAPRIADTRRVWIAPGAIVLGDVTLAEDASVWFSAVLRGDTEPISIGPGANIQDGAVLHTDPGFPLRVGARCTVGHRAILHGCTVGEESLIGMGAIVLNGARIGCHCIVGAGALVLEGREIPDNSLVLGMPAKPVRTLDEAAAEGLRASAERYIANARRYLDSFGEV